MEKGLRGKVGTERHPCVASASALVRGFWQAADRVQDLCKFVAFPRFNEAHLLTIRVCSELDDFCWHAFVFGIHCQSPYILAVMSCRGPLRLRASAIFLLLLVLAHLLPLRIIASLTSILIAFLPLFVVRFVLWQHSSFRTYFFDQFLSGRVKRCRTGCSVMHRSWSSRSPVGFQVTGTHAMSLVTLPLGHAIGDLHDPLTVEDLVHQSRVR